MSNAFPKPLLMTLHVGAPLTREQVRALALEAGFTEAGLVALPHANQERDAARFEEWVRAGRAGYDALPGADGARMGGCCERGLEFRFRGRARRWFALRTTTAQQPRSTEPAAEGAGWIARYAWSSKVDADGQTAAKRLSQGAAEADENAGGAAA